MSNETLLFAFNPLYGANMHSAMDFLFLKCQSLKLNLNDEQSREHSGFSTDFE